MERDDQTDFTFLSRYFTNQSTESEKQELLLWINKSIENEKLFFTLKEIYAAGNWEQLKVEANTKTEWEKLKKNLIQVSPEEAEDGHGAVRFFFANLLRYAAVLVLGLTIAFGYQYFSKPEREAVKMSKIETGKGDRSRIYLPDGTAVCLNVCSTLSYGSNYGDSARNVYLEGEAYFEVKKNRGKPFIVNTSGFKVKALGTTFNVSAYKNDRQISAVLVEGSISFGKTSEGNASLVKPGERVFYSKTEDKTSIEKVDTDDFTVWTTGEYRFEHLDFIEISKRLERLFNIKIVLLNKRISKTPFSGTFKDYESLKQILEVICTNAKLSYTIKKDTVYIK